MEWYGSVLCAAREGVRVARGGVASARRGLESRSVPNRDLTARRADELRALQGAHGERGRRPMDAEHVGQEALLDGQYVGAEAVVRDQQPSRAPLFDRVKPVA